MIRKFFYHLKDSTVIPEVHGHSPLFNGQKIYNYKYSIARSNFWIFLAKHNKYYKRFYSEINEKIVSPSLMDLKSENLNELCNKLDKFGVSYIPDFFPSSQYEDVLKEIHNEKKGDSSRPNDGLYGNVKYWNHFLKKDNSYLDNLKNSISYISEKLLFPISKNRIRINYSRLTKKDQIEDGDPNTIFHSDRFIPTLKFFYYPYACNIDSAPFEFIPFSHYINDSFINSYKKYMLDVSKNLKAPNPCAIDYKNGIKPISLTVPKNSLVAAYTNGMHRRRPFPQRDKNKSTFERNTIVTLLYNQQTKLSFLKLSL